MESALLAPEPIVICFHATPKVYKDFSFVWGGANEG